MYASIVKDAMNSGLVRLEELGGKKYIANNLALDAQNILPILLQNYHHLHLI